MKKLFVLNCVVAPKGITRLNNLLTSLFERCNIDFETYHITDKIGNLADFSHLLITGSALFASEDNECDAKIYNIIQQFRDKSILGICFGHQVLAKALTKRRVCRKSNLPELGWRKVNIIENPLFKGISKPIFYESHFEEVFDLNDKFSIIASNSNCDIQGFQYDNLPIWGVQFHPEVSYEYGQHSIKNRRTIFEKKGGTFKNELQNQAQLEQNLNIFKNFIKYGSES